MRFTRIGKLDRGVIDEVAVFDEFEVGGFGVGLFIGREETPVGPGRLAGLVCHGNWLIKQTVERIDLGQGIGRVGGDRLIAGTQTTEFCLANIRGEGASESVVDLDQIKTRAGEFGERDILTGERIKIKCFWDRWSSAFADAAGTITGFTGRARVAGIGLGANRSSE